MNSVRQKWRSMPDLKKRRLKRAAGIILGASAGYVYYITIGCSSGGCPITSNPWISTGWGALIGLTATG